MDPKLKPQLFAMPSISRKILLLALTLATCCGVSQTVLAQGISDQERFELNAQIDERPQLSRDELTAPGIDNGAPLSTGISQDAMPGALPMPEIAPEPNMSFPLNATTQDTPPHESTPFPLSASNQAENTQVAMAEYGVDWSAWISRLADLWFFNLKKLTDKSAYEFHISTPARIRFTCWPNGRITDISVKRSSGVPLYDQLQIEALQRTKSPPFPAGTQKTSNTLVLGWDSHPRQSRREQTFTPGSFDPGVTLEKIKQWIYWR